MPDVINLNVLIPGTPQLSCCTVKHRPAMSHTVSTVLPEARDSHASQASLHILCSGQRVDREAGPHAEMILSMKACSPAAVFLITCLYMVQLIRLSSPSSSSPSHNPTQLFERPINNKGGKAPIPPEDGCLVPFTAAPTLKSYPSYN